jgi:GGDEF domain-containing protein
VQAANAAVHLIHDLHADAAVLDRALTELGLELTVLDEIVPAALPALAPAATGLVARVATLERAATTDEITGLLTRGPWMEAVRKELEDRAGVVLVADLRGLGVLDERHGYASGNLVLSELARIIGRRGIAGRLGGDALALWAPIPAGDAGALAAAILDDVRTRFAAEDVAVDVVLGSAPAQPGDDVTALLTAAVAAGTQPRAA